MVAKNELKQTPDSPVMVLNMPQFRLVAVLWLFLFVGVYLGLASVVISEIGPISMFWVFSVSLVFIGMFLTVETRCLAVRALSHVGVASAIAVAIVIYLRGTLSMVMLVGSIKRPTDLTAFVSTPYGCTVAAMEFVAFTSIALEVCRCMFSTACRAAILTLILLAAWFVLFSIACDNRPPAVA